ncbi:MAG: hypothetical protein WC758_08375 [Candidatus Woesearchaeota archaeon]|jgi:hypothetical protein
MIEESAISENTTNNSSNNVQNSFPPNCISLELILVTFNLKKVELTPTQKTKYIEENNKRYSWIGTKYEQAGFKTTQLTEKEFYITELNKALSYKQLFKRLDQCQTQGHIESNGHVVNGETYAKCKRCKLTYFRQSSSDEIKRFIQNSQIPL